jgi:hypothetical protein
MIDFIIWVLQNIALAPYHLFSRSPIRPLG